MSQDLPNDLEGLLNEYHTLKVEQGTYDYEEIEKKTNRILQRHPKVLKGAAEILKANLEKELPLWWMIHGEKLLSYLRLPDIEVSDDVFTNHENAIKAFDRLYNDLHDKDKFAIDEIRRLSFRPVQINTRLSQIRDRADVLDINLDDYPEPPRHQTFSIDPNWKESPSHLKQEAAKILCVDPKTIYDYVKQGRLKETGHDQIETQSIIDLLKGK